MEARSRALPCPRATWCWEGQDVGAAHVYVHTLGESITGQLGSRESLPHAPTRVCLLARPAELHGAHRWAPCPPGLSATLVKAAGVRLEHVFHQGPMGALEMKTN